MKNKNVLFITQGAAIAALYFVFSWISQALGLASGVIQVRISEAFCILGAFTPAAIPGLTIGCFLFNFSSGALIQDVLFGSLATLIGAASTYFLALYFNKSNSQSGSDLPLYKKAATFLLPLPTVLANAFIVPYVLIKFYEVPDAYWFCFLTVGAGEFIACEIGGMILYYALRPVKNIIFQTGTSFSK